MEIIKAYELIGLDLISEGSRITINKSGVILDLGNYMISKMEFDLDSTIEIRHLASKYYDLCIRELNFSFDNWICTIDNEKLGYIRYVKRKNILERLGI